MNENQEENMSVEKLISDMIDMLCTEKPSCSAINNVVCEDSKSSDESDNTSWTTKHYRLGIAAFLPKTLKSKKVLTRKRTMSPEMRGEASLRQDSVVAAKTAKLTGEQELSNNVPRQRCSNFHEIYRDKETFEVKSLGFGFSIGHSCNNYIKSCQWSSCGKYLATVSQDRFARIFEFLPEKPELDAKSTISMGDLVYDSCWHPVSSCFVGSSKDHPIHMWDSNGHWLATFRGMNSMDELDSAYSLCFTPDGHCLYAGYKNVIRKFDVNRPGCQISELVTWKKETRGQKGIISALAVNPVLPSNYAAGSYNRSGKCVIECQLPAITSLRYSADGNFLFTVGRKDDDIICWDLRYPGKIHSLYRRPSATNQRLYLDIDSSGTYLFSGSSAGELYVFDLKCANSDEPTPPYVRVPAHRSTLCGVSIHKEKPVVATCSGQRIFPSPTFNEIDEINTEPEDEYENINSHELLDNSLALWSFDQ